MTAKQQVQTLFPLDKRKGYKCECCGQFVKIYCRTFNANMSIALLFLYRHREQGFIHLENLMAKAGYKRCGDFSYLRHYYLIEPLSEKRADTSNRNGMYRITGRGIMFCEKALKVQENFLMYNNKCQGFEGEEVDIVKTLGKKFDYQKLMEA